MYNFFTAFLLVIALSATALTLSSLFTYPSTVSRLVHPVYGSKYSVRMQSNSSFTTESQRVLQLREHLCNAYNGSQNAALSILTQFDRSLTFLDIGADTGNVSLAALFCVPTLHRVVSVEPVSSRYETLLRRMEELSEGDLESERFFAKRLAFANESGHRVVTVEQTGNLKASSATSQRHKKIEQVHFVRGDEFLEKNGLQPNVIRVDVGVDELRVLQGMERWLKSQQNLMVLVEHNNKLLSSMGSEWSKVYDYMSELQFTAHCKPVAESRGGEFHTGSVGFTREQVQSVGCSQLVYWKHLSSNMGSVVGRF